MNQSFSEGTTLTDGLLGKAAEDVNDKIERTVVGIRESSEATDVRQITFKCDSLDEGQHKGSPHAGRLAAGTCRNIKQESIEEPVEEDMNTGVFIHTVDDPPSNGVHNNIKSEPATDVDAQFGELPRLKGEDSAGPSGPVENSTEEVEKAGTGERPFHCDICDSSFRLAVYLRAHINRIHSKEKLYFCYFCESRFKEARSLRRHVMTHTGEKPFVCDVCESRFTQDATLKVHKRIHSGEKSYVCDVCPSRFNAASSLKRHKRIHTGEKPYFCDLCESSFRNSSTLKSHMKTRHLPRDA